MRLLILLVIGLSICAVANGQCNDTDYLACAQDVAQVWYYYASSM